VDTFELWIGCEPGDVSTARHALHGWLGGRGLSRDMVDAVTLATHEAVLNAATYAKPGASIKIRGRLEAEMMFVEVADRGSRPLSAVEDGLGHRLITGLMQDVQTVSGPSGTTVRMSRPTA